MSTSADTLVHWHAGPLGDDQFCMACDASDECQTCGGDKHGPCVLPCAYCQRPSVTTHGIDHVCADCNAELVRGDETARRLERMAPNEDSYSRGGRYAEAE